MRFAVATIISALSLGTSVFATPILSSSVIARTEPVAYVNTITSAVSTLSVDVYADLNVTVSSVKTIPAIVIVPFVEFNIAKIITSFNVALAAVIPVAFAGPIILAEAEVALLLESVKIFNALLLTLKAQFDFLLITLNQDALILIKVQLEAALKIASLLGKAYVASVTDIVNVVIDVETGILVEVKNKVFDITHIIDTVLCVL